jgi:hypothetical protein
MAILFYLSLRVMQSIIVSALDGLHLIIVDSRLAFHLKEGSARLGNVLAGSVWERVVSRKEAQAQAH